MYRSLLLILILFTTTAIFSQGGKRVKILNADEWIFDKNIGDEAQRLIGNVRFKHKNVLMFCDSAYMYADNKIEAFSHVRIQQGDTLNTYSDRLLYDPDDRMAELTGNVRLENPDMELATDHLNYDLKNNLAYYSTGGHIISDENQNVLYSNKGSYLAGSRMFFFSDSVRLTNPDYEVVTDTLRYSTSSKVSYFLGPSTILQDSSLIYCENGWYDTERDISSFEENAYIIYKDQRLEGDSLYYDRNTGMGKVIGNVQITDTVNNLIINGDLGLYNERTDISWVTGRAMMTQTFEDDPLFLHGDTLLSIPDSNKEFRSIRAYNGVRFYKTDMQGKCDSLIYSEIDSTLHMYNDPILWSEQNQIIGEFIDLRIQGGSIDRLYIQNSAFIISKADSTLFNQIKGKNMTGYFKDNDIYKVLVEGNGQTLYYATEEKEGTKKILGANWAECSNILLFITESEIDRISFLTKPNMILYPVDDVPTDRREFDDFRWEDDIRPMEKEDIFN